MSVLVLEFTGDGVDACFEGVGDEVVSIGELGALGVVTSDAKGVFFVWFEDAVLVGFHAIEEHACLASVACVFEDELTDGVVSVADDDGEVFDGDGVDGALWGVWGVGGVGVIGGGDGFWVANPEDADFAWALVVFLKDDGFWVFVEVGVELCFVVDGFDTESAKSTVGFGDDGVSTELGVGVDGMRCAGETLGDVFVGRNTNERQNCRIVGETGIDGGFEVFIDPGTGISGISGVEHSQPGHGPEWSAVGKEHEHREVNDRIGPVFVRGCAGPPRSNALTAFAGDEQAEDFECDPPECHGEEEPE